MNDEVLIYLPAPLLAKEGTKDKAMKSLRWKVRALNSALMLFLVLFSNPPARGAEPTSKYFYEIGRASCRERVCQYV